MSDVLPIRQRPAQRRFAFTTARVEQHPAPATGRVFLSDTRCPDLRLQVTANGARTYYVVRKFNGKPLYYQIGPTDKIGLDDARDLARDVVAGMVKGIDPRIEKRAVRTATTFGEAAAGFIEKKKSLGRKSWAEDERQVGTYLRSWKSRALTEIQHQHVESLHGRLGVENGHYVANRVLALLSAIFEHATRGQVNPCKGIDRFPEEKRERFLQPNELPKFFAAVNAEPSQQIRDYIYVSLLTGARRGNVLAMKWQDLDLDRGIWTIPITKSGKSLTLPLVPDVVRILQARPRESEFVFPSRVGGVGHMRDAMRGWRNILKRAGLTDLRPHDLRRTLASWQAGANVSLAVIGRSLGHSTPSATAIYARLHLDPVREAVTAAATAIVKAGKPKKK